MEVAVVRRVSDAIERDASHPRASRQRATAATQDLDSAGLSSAYKPSRSTLPTSTAPAVPKESAHGTASKTGDIAKQTSFQSAVPPSGGGLSKGAIGGMVTGVVLCLVAVLVASFLIIRRLNTVARNSQRSQSTRGQYSDVGRPAMKQTKRPNHYHADSGGSTTVVSSGPGGYAPVPSSDTSGSLYHGSAQAQGQRQDYFGPPNPDQQGWNGYASPERIGTPPPTHGRSLSDTSTTTNGSFQGPPRRDTLDSNASELEAPDYRSPLERSFAVFGNRRPSLWGGRRSSSGQEAARARGLSQPSRLENVAEGDGSQIDVTQMRRVQH
ncbi:MAG: hypothetical protein M4579_005882 [Chaenotheca gracillima]|nr:MAG: hypothetical protein M4579_005882 [Chaenotheca gracillima]